MILKLLGVLAVIGAIAPVAMAGGAMIAAFMVGKNMVAWLLITTATMVSLVVVGIVVLQVLMPIAEAGQIWARVASAVLLVAAPWSVLWVGKRLFKLNEPKEQA